VVTVCRLHSAHLAAHTVLCTIEALGLEDPTTHHSTSTGHAECQASVNQISGSTQDAVTATVQSSPSRMMLWLMMLWLKEPNERWSR
jgi:hypothetical protein